MRDGPWRKLIKAVARELKRFDLMVTRTFHKRDQRYRLLGSCNGCGRCCEAPSIPVSRVIWFVRTFRTLFLWWQREVNGFELVDRDPRFKIFTFRCTHFDPVTKKCDSYESRPLMCRDYPMNHTFDAVPALFPECSYVIQAKNADALKASLVAAGVQGEKLAEMEAKLFLRGVDEKKG